MKVKVVRYVHMNGTEPQAPEPAYAVLQDGKVLFNLTAEQLDEIVGKSLGEARSPNFYDLSPEQSANIEEYLRGQ